ncbi:hypothetical protein SALBM311S_11695 [Streptomyces alboniger]
MLSRCGLADDEGPFGQAGRKLCAHEGVLGWRQPFPIVVPSRLTAYSLGDLEEEQTIPEDAKLRCVRRSSQRRPGTIELDPPRPCTCEVPETPVVQGTRTKEHRQWWMTAHCRTSRFRSPKASFNVIVLSSRQAERHHAGDVRCARRCRHSARTARRPQSPGHPRPRPVLHRRYRHLDGRRDGGSRRRRLAERIRLSAQVPGRRSARPVRPAGDGREAGDPGCQRALHGHRRRNGGVV